MSSSARGNSIACALYHHKRNDNLLPIATSQKSTTNTLSNRQFVLLKKNDSTGVFFYPKNAVQLYCPQCVFHSRPTHKIASALPPFSPPFCVPKNRNPPLVMFPIKRPVSRPFKMQFIRHVNHRVKLAFAFWCNADLTQIIRLRHSKNRTNLHSTILNKFIAAQRPPLSIKPRENQTDCTHVGFAHPKSEPKKIFTKLSKIPVIAFLFCTPSESEKDRSQNKNDVISAF